jgi:hypothetical protein
MLHKSHNYLNKNVSFLVNTTIIEYDLKSAGFNLIKEFKLVGERQLKILEELGKKERQIRIGLLQRNDKELGKKLNECFVEARRRFITSNNIKDDEILSIKKDAIFVTRFCDNTKIGDYLEFDVKSHYSSYYYLNKLELYYNGMTNTLDVKGISDDLLELHKDYFLDLLKTIFKMMESTDSNTVRHYLVKVCNYYKNRQLETGYYRTLSRDSLFIMESGGSKDRLIGLYESDEDEQLCIHYNYVNYLIPLINILL